MANELSNLHPVDGAQRPRTRIGRGQGSGLGKTAGRGTKGQQARGGAHIANGFEGGAIPLKRRIPKHGFTNIFAKDFTELNIERLVCFEAGAVVDAAALKEAGIIARIGRNGVKLLGRGEIEVALVVQLARVSAGARAKIEAAGGRVEAVA